MFYLLIILWKFCLSKHWTENTLFQENAENKIVGPELNKSCSL